MAAALIVPVAGIVSAQGAGAAASPNVTCTTNTGTLKASTGISLTVRRGITFSTKGGELSGCTGIGISEETTAALSFTVQRPAVNCKSIKGALFQGSGKIVWGDGSNAGIVNKIKLNVKFTTLTSVAFSGKVTGNQYLAGQKIAGTATIPASLKPAGAGDGTCGNSGKSRVKSLDYTNSSDFTIGVAAAA